MQRLMATRREGFNRRQVIKVAAVSIVTLLSAAHTPYGQWTVYRRRNLFIVASRTDTRAMELAQILVRGLLQQLPESKARFTRANDPVRIASLLATGQLDVAIVTRKEAVQTLAGSGDFKAVGPVPLRQLAEVGEHLLVTVESFRDRHAFLLAEAVEHMRLDLPVAVASSQGPHIAEHPGATAYRHGKKLLIPK
jgi:hypothetical protein